MTSADDSFDSGDVDVSPDAAPPAESGAPGCADYFGVAAPASPSTTTAGEGASSGDKTTSAAEADHTPSWVSGSGADGLRSISAADVDAVRPASGGQAPNAALGDLFLKDRAACVAESSGGRAEAAEIATTAPAAPSWASAGSAPRDYLAHDVDLRSSAVDKSSSSSSVPGIPGQRVSAEDGVDETTERPVSSRRPSWVASPQITNRGVQQLVDEPSDVDISEIADQVVLPQSVAAGDAGRSSIDESPGESASDRSDAALTAVAGTSGAETSGVFVQGHQVSQADVASGIGDGVAGHSSLDGPGVGSSGPDGAALAGEVPHGDVQVVVNHGDDHNVSTADAATDNAQAGSFFVVPAQSAAPVVGPGPTTKRDTTQNSPNNTASDTTEVSADHPTAANPVSTESAPHPVSTESAAPESVALPVDVPDASAPEPVGTATVPAQRDALPADSAHVDAADSARGDAADVTSENADVTSEKPVTADKDTSRNASGEVGLWGLSGMHQWTLCGLILIPLLPQFFGTQSIAAYSIGMMVGAGSALCAAMAIRKGAYSYSWFTRLCVTFSLTVGLLCVAFAGQAMVDWPRYVKYQECLENALTPVAKASCQSSR